MVVSDKANFPSQSDASKGPQSHCVEQYALPCPAAKKFTVLNPMMWARNETVTIASIAAGGWRVVDGEGRAVVSQQRARRHAL